MGLLIITSAAITPGIQPQTDKIKTIIIDPQPLSITANGGQIIDNITLQILMLIFLILIDDMYLTYKWAFCYIIAKRLELEN